MKPPRRVDVNEVEIFYITNMQLIDFKMIKNTKRIAETKLSQHRIAGKDSALSIFDVANLMDVMNRAEELSHTSNEPNIFHSMVYN